MRFPFLSFGLAIALAGGCSKSHNPLETIPEESIVKTDRAQVSAQVDVWPGEPQTLSQVTPVRLTVENTSNEDLRLDYKNFVLRTADGEERRALPPFEVEGTIERPVATGRVDPLGFDHTGFEVAPYYSSIYPDLRRYNGVYGYDSFYHDRYYSIWEEVSLPTDTMLQRAMPEGVLRPGGKVSGFLYFERVDDDTQGAVLEAKLHDAESGRQVVEATIPFEG